MQAFAFRATVAYDGTDFLGFQWQSTGRTVQGVLEAALEQLTGAPARVVGAGRTDAGVHARGQVVGFRADWRHSEADLHRALNAMLPADVAVEDLAQAAADWHPRFSARRRAYRYMVLNRPVRSPLERRYAHWVREPLAVSAMQAAADLLVGEHDFASFGQPMRPEESTVRAVYSAAWTAAGADLWAFDVVGNAFLRGMVRSLVGALLQVGVGRWPVAQVSETLAARNRALAAPPAPACGLCLLRVDYD